MARIYIHMNDGNPTRRFTNGLIALITGALTLIMPEMLTIIIAAYLISNGIVYFIFRSALFIGALSIIAGIVIYSYPDLISWVFAFFLLVFSFGAILSGGLTLIGITAFVFGLIILGTPEFVNVVIGIFLLVFGSVSWYKWYEMKKASQDSVV